MSVLLVAGATASGKTRLAIDLARALDGEVVNADSQQVYRGLDAGTAKPTREEQAEVPHHLFDVADPGAGFDAARYVALADRAIAEIAARGRLPVVCGGTGLYIRALLHGVADAPGRDPALRARLEAEAERDGRPALHARLAVVDPAAAAKIGPNDLVRITRALEIAASGRTQSEVFGAHAFREDRYRFRLLALDPPRQELHRRIEARAPRMLEGLVSETGALLSGAGQGAGPLPPKLPIGYADAALHLAGAITRDEALRRLVIAHRRYARRQMVWLRREPGVEWLSPPVDVDALSKTVAAWRIAASP
ncbi:MAG: tRNA (adenosine(37)-N6)-dimethylallyltransferase MiaA [Anaeromyxobacteraceae bacterium]